MIFDLNEEARKLRAAGITVKQIQNEQSNREISENELRYFGITNERIPNGDEDCLSKYNDKQLEILKGLVQEQEYNATHVSDENILSFENYEPEAV